VDIGRIVTQQPDADQRAKTPIEDRGQPRDESQARPVTARPAPTEHGRMTETHVIRLGSGPRVSEGRTETDSLETLFAEIATYLEAVDAFRREGHEPTWRSEVLR
jgi:hypothetical protein